MLAVLLLLKLEWMLMCSALTTITASCSEKILRLYMRCGLGHHYGFVVFAYDVDFELLLKG